MSDYTRTFDIHPDRKMTIENMKLICLSVLHFGINSLCCFIHVGYNQDFCKWSAWDKNDKVCKAQKEAQQWRKQNIHDEFREKKGLAIDEIRDCGTSMDGNTARRAFQDPEFLSKLCGVPTELVRGIYVIWIALSCEKKINPRKLGEFSKKIKSIWDEHCHWYKIPSTVHKILVHAEYILELLPPSLTCGHLSEEPSEHMGKDIKNWQVSHARQSSRVNRIRDVFERQMDRSCPITMSYVIEKRIKRQKRDQELPPEVIAMLDELAMDEDN